MSRSILSMWRFDLLFVSLLLFFLNLIWKAFPCIMNATVMKLTPNEYLKVRIYHKSNPGTHQASMVLTARSRIVCILCIDNILYKKNKKRTLKFSTFIKSVRGHDNIYFWSSIKISWIAIGNWLKFYASGFIPKFDTQMGSPLRYTEIGSKMSKYSHSIYTKI